MAEKTGDAAADGRGAASTLGEFAFQRIREDILSGRLAPGLRLRFQMLQEMYDLNVGTLREGLARLTAEGLVLLEGQKGFQVADVSRDDLNDLTELRMLVDTLALRLSIERGDLEWESQVVAAFHQLSRAPREIDPKTGGNQVWELRHRAFHRALVSGSNSAVLIQTHVILFDRGERYRRLKRIHRPVLRNTDAEHEEIMDATIRHKIDLACSLLRIHITKSRDNILEAFELEAMPSA